VSVSVTKVTKATLLAVADPGSVLLGWSGACSGPTCTLVVTGAETATVTFADRWLDLRFRAWDAS
jgi:hypothetical protein